MAYRCACKHVHYLEVWFRRPTKRNADKGWNADHCVLFLFEELKYNASFPFNEPQRQANLSSFTSEHAAWVFTCSCEGGHKVWVRCRTWELWRPRPRWILQHSSQIRTPRLIEAQRGSKKDKEKLWFDEVLHITVTDSPQKADLDIIHSSSLPTYCQNLKTCQIDDKCINVEPWVCDSLVQMARCASFHGSTRWSLWIIFK